MTWTKRHSRNAVAAKARKRMAQPEPAEGHNGGSLERRIRLRHLRHMRAWAVRQQRQYERNQFGWIHALGRIEAIDGMLDYLLKQPNDRTERPEAT